MATANYMTMENFPLFVKEFNTQIKRCPACGLYQDCENDVCEECGEELEEELFMIVLNARRRWTILNPGLKMMSMAV